MMMMMIPPSKVHEHHDNEEAVFFPRLETLVGVPGLMTANVEQHEAFHGGLAALIAYIEAVQAGGDSYDGARLRGIVDSFMPMLTEHLHDEIETLVALDRYGDKCDWAAWMKDMAAEILAKMKADPEAKVSALLPRSRRGGLLTTAIPTPVPGCAHVPGTS